MGALSVVIITLNEESNLVRCIGSLPKGCEVIVVDSNSTDKTLHVARTLGARVECREFTNYAEQKNYACSLATNDWVLSLDADEVLSPDLRDSILQTLTPESRFKGYKLNRRLVFQGRTLRFGKSSDTPIRLFRRTSTKFTGSIHEKLDLKADEISLFPSGYLSHYSYTNLEDYFVRFNRYTGLISENQAQKSPSFRFYLNLYFRFWFEFLNRYFLRLGCLDGYPGYCYALISSLYTFVKYAKIRELYDSRN